MYTKADLDKAITDYFNCHGTKIRERTIIDYFHIHNFVQYYKNFVDRVLIAGIEWEFSKLVSIDDIHFGTKVTEYLPDRFNEIYNESLAYMGQHFYKHDYNFEEKE